MLNKKQLKQLHDGIVLNSLLLKDYSNTLFIKEKTACAFFDSYIKNLNDIAAENNDQNIDIYDLIDKYDNIDNLYNFYNDLCIDGYDPLLQDDYIAYKHINNSDGIVIYLIDDYILYPTVKTAFIYSNLFNGSVNTKIKNNKLYESKRNGYYFIKNHQRYYINDFMKTNFLRG